MSSIRGMRWRQLAVLGVVSVLAGGCQLSSSASRPSSAGRFHPTATSAHTRTGELIGSPGWPRHPRVVGTIKAVHPAADEITQFKSIMLAAYARACPDVAEVHGVFRRYHVRGLYGAQSQLIEVRCGAGQA